MSDDLTLVFELEALQQLADPASALEDARSWAVHVGAVSDETPERISSLASREGFELDFAAEATGETGGLAVLRQQYPTWRHVVIGTSDGDREAARSHGWEYLDLGEAAVEAGWDLAAAERRWRDTRSARESPDGTDAGGDGRI